LSIESSGNLTINNSVFSNNSNPLNGGALGGGTINVGGSGNSLTVSGSTFLNNSGIRSGGIFCANDAQTTVVNSLFNTNSSLGSNAGLNPLGNYGGQVQTMSLRCDSPALNAGNNAFALDANGNPLTTDARGAGFPRNLEGTVDIGAFESNRSFVSNVSDNISTA